MIPSYNFVGIWGIFVTIHGACCQSLCLWDAAFQTSCWHFLMSVGQVMKVISKNTIPYWLWETINWKYKSVEDADCMFAKLKAFEVQYTASHCPCFSTRILQSIVIVGRDVEVSDCLCYFLSRCLRCPIYKSMIRSSSDLWWWFVKSCNATGYVTFHSHISRSYVGLNVCERLWVDPSFSLFQSSSNCLKAFVFTRIA